MSALPTLPQTAFKVRSGSDTLSFWQAGTHSLPAALFARMLTDHDLSNLVIILSACHSRSFIDDLAAPDRIVITASAADRESFGCEDGREWTFWGRAFFARALSQTDDPREAFGIARDLVTEWEKERGFDPSNPQMDVGPEIAATLDAWFADRPDRKADLSR